MNNRIPLLVEELSQQPVPVGMMAYFQNRVQQCRNVHRSCRPARWKLDCRFYSPFLSCCGHRHVYLQRCHRRSCDDCLIHDFIYFICEYSGFGSPLNYKGQTVNASGKARFSGKIPERSEDDFSRNRKARPCRPNRSVCQLCPVVLRSVNGCICCSFLSNSYSCCCLSIKLRIQKEPPDRTAPFCKVLQKSVWYIRFISSPCQKTR